MIFKCLIKYILLIYKKQNTPDQLLFEYILFESNSFETFYIDWCWTGENEYIDTNVGQNGGHFWLTISIKEM